MKKERMNNMSKNILMTTMSTLYNRQSLNYYYLENKSVDSYQSTSEPKFQFCSGISSLEVGSKYILSKYKIDEIVVVGSKETFNQCDDKHSDFLKCYTDAQIKEMDVEEINRMSPFAFYKYRIALFLKEKSREAFKEDEKVASFFVGISERQKEIEEIAKKAVKERLKKLPQYSEESEIIADNQVPVLLYKYFNHLKSLEQQQELLKLVKNYIEDNIKEKFKSEEVYKHYLKNKQELLKRGAALYEDNMREMNHVADYMREREKIKKEKLSFLEKEFLFATLRASINENTRLDKEAELIEIRNENARINYELETIKTRRKDNEFNFAKYVIYKMLQSPLTVHPDNVTTDSQSIKITFVPEKTDNEENDNISEIVHALYGDIGVNSKNNRNLEEDIHLYIDMQGGERTSGYVRTAVLSILNNQNPQRVHIEQMVATKFDRSLLVSQIVDETKRYKINDLVSGMNAFVRYGKADMIQEYYKYMKAAKGSEDKVNTKVLKEKEPIEELINQMVNIDHAISLCNISSLITAIKNMRELFKKSDESDKNSKNKSYVDNIFSILKDGISSDYGELLTVKNDAKNSDEKIDYLELIDWCRKKGFYQQALTIYIEKMPEFYIDKEILPDWILAQAETMPASRNHSKECELFYTEFWDKIGKDEKAVCLCYELERFWQAEAGKEITYEKWHAFFEEKYKQRKEQEELKMLAPVWDKLIEIAEQTKGKSKLIVPGSRDGYKSFNTFLSELLNYNKNCMKFVLGEDVDNGKQIISCLKESIKQYIGNNLKPEQWQGIFKKKKEEQKRKEQEEQWKYSFLPKEVWEGLCKIEKGEFIDYNSNKENQPKSLIGFVNQILQQGDKEKYKKNLHDKDHDYEAWQNQYYPQKQKNNEKKVQAIINMENNIENETIKTQYKNIMIFYLAAKIIRNTINHADDINENEGDVKKQMKYLESQQIKIGINPVDINTLLSHSIDWHKNTFGN